jgi:AGCS family alanine or glycine:cation symporter
MLQAIERLIGDLNGILFSEAVVIALLVTGVLFTSFWSAFGQYRALTHGVSVTRGKFDRKGDPGAINHFQALSTALSATVGLGNIAGVSVAVALGGPGAIFWMWVVGVVGMALKMTEVTQSMIFRNTDDRENPHGGPMFVVKRGIEESLAKGRGLSIVTGVVFAAVTLWCAAQWGIAHHDPETGLAPVHWVLMGLALAFAALLVVLSIVRGALMGSLIGGIFVITLIISAITGGNMFQAWNVADITATYFQTPKVVPGVIMTVLVGAVIIGGIKRIGAVTGRLVPFMCVMYLLAGLYAVFSNIGDMPRLIGLIFSSGIPEWLGGSAADPHGAFLGGTFGYAAMWGVKRALFSSEAGQGSAPIAHSAAKTDEPVREGVVAGLEPFIDTLVVCSLTALVVLSSGAYDRPPEARFLAPERVEVVPVQKETGETIPDTWTLRTGLLPEKTPEAKEILRIESGPGWKAGETILFLVDADRNEDTGRDIRKITGTVRGSADAGWTVEWGTLVSTQVPKIHALPDGSLDTGIYGDYAGASLTAHAFDRINPGLGMWLVTFACWLFAVSTMISWSYYGEQGVVYLFARTRKSTKDAAIWGYKIVYCLLILFTTIAAMPIIPQEHGGKRPLIGTDTQLDNWTTLGLGVMLVANIPIMLIFGPRAMREYHRYIGKLKRGEFHPHVAPPITDVVEGKDVR